MKTQTRCKIKYSDDPEQKMVRHLMLKSIFIKDCGLLHGKMGVAMFFYHYSKYTDNAVYSDFADDLLDEVWNTAYNNLPVSFASGLIGIALGIEYLLLNDFAAGNSNEICEELDYRIMSFDVRRLNAEFVEKELEGLLHYILIRIKGSIKQQIELPFDEMYRNDLFHVFDRLRNHENINNTCCSLLTKYHDFMSDSRNLDYQPDLTWFIDANEISEKNILDAPLGLKDGLAGQLYKQITTPEK